jgi:large subunit ribosomal protein L28
MTGNKRSHSNRKARTRWIPNLKTKRIYIPETKETLRLTLSTKAIKTIDKHGGLMNAIRAMPEANLSVRLQKLRRRTA